MATVFLGYRRTAYDRLSASWKDNCWSVYTQNQHSSYSMSSSRNSDESRHLGVWVFHDNAPAHKSLVAQQALCNCFFVQLNHPAYSPDLAPSNYFQIRNLKYRLRRTWFIDDESLKIDVKAWSESRNRKVYFQGINSWEQKLKICIDVAWEYVKNDSMCDIIAKLQKFLIAPRT